MARRIDTEGLVIQRFAFGESSQIVHLLTEALGRVVVLARGSWRDRNSYEGPLDLLQRGRVTISLIEGRELGLLVQRRIATNYPGVRRDLDRFTAASHLLRQVLHFEPVGQGGSDAFRLLDRGLAAAETTPVPRLPLLMLAFDLRLARLHGLVPELTQCVRCGSPRALERFVPQDGGLVCRPCLTRTDEGRPVDAASAALLRRLLEQPLVGVPDPPVPTLRRARQLVAAHLTFHAETAPAAGVRRRQSQQSQHGRLRVRPLRRLHPRA